MQAAPPQPSSHFTFVLIPANDDDSMQEVTLQQPQDLNQNLSCLTTYLNDYFRKHGGDITEQGRNALLDSMRKHMSQQSTDAKADETLLEKVAMSQTVDIVQLLPATRASDYYGVTMYVDDKAVGKGSPSNRRASEICVACGLSTDIRGDAFVSRSWDDQEGYARLDFRISEMQSDASWLLAARHRNADRPDLEAAAAKLKHMGKEEVKQPSRPEVTLDKRLVLLRESREEGTNKFKGGDFQGAQELYESGLSLYDPMPDMPEDMKTIVNEIRVACLLNVASCHLRLEQAIQAIVACDTATAIHPNNAKAWYRRAQGCQKLGQYAAACRNLTAACRLAPGSREIRDEFDKCKQLAAKSKPL